MTEPDRSDVDVISDDVLLDEYFHVRKLRLRHKLTDGGWSGEMDRYILHRPDAVCAMVLNLDRMTTYLVRQFRIGAFQKEDGWTIELPAGLVDKGESHEDALKRELVEEIGFVPRSLELVDSYFASPGILTERIFSYYVEVTEADRIADGGGLEHEHEDIEILEVPIDKLVTFSEENRIRDAKTVAGLLRLEMILRLRGLIA